MKKQEFLLVLSKQMQIDERQKEEDKDSALSSSS